MTNYCRALVANLNTDKERKILNDINNSTISKQKKNHFYINPSQTNTDPDDLDKLINSQNSLITTLQTYSNVNVLELSVSRFETLLKEISKKSENK